MPLSNTCMGVLKFNTEEDILFKEIIQPLVESYTGLKYTDARKYYESITAKMSLIEKMIEEAHLIIADINYDNPSVFMEIGIAYYLKKPIVLLCSGKNWTGQPPFDLQGREVLIYKDTNDLKALLGKYIFDALYKTREVCLFWDSDIAENNMISPASISISKPGIVWSSLGVKNNFTLSYRIKIISQRSVLPDVRVSFAASPHKFPRLVTIFPWESIENVDNKYECHIDLETAEDTEHGENHIRLIQKPIAENKDINEYAVFISFCYPNLVVESNLFEVPRLILSFNHLNNKDYQTHLAQYIGFQSKNCHLIIEDIEIKEVYL